MEKGELLENVLRALLASGVLQSELAGALQAVCNDSVSDLLHNVVIVLMVDENDEF